MSRIILNQIALQKIKVISETKKYFLLQPSSAAAPSTSNYGITPPTYTQTGYSGWSDTEPSYTVGDDRVLYELTETIYSDRTWDYSTPTISSSYKVAKEAYNKTIQAEEDIQDFVDLGLKQGYIWDNPTSKSASGTIPVYPAGSYIASGILSGGTRSINRSNSNTYGLNTWISTGGINLRYNAIDLMKLTTSNLFFYYPSTSTQQKKAISLGTNGAVNSLAFYGFNNDNKTMELTNNALTFYNPSNGTDELATLNANGLVLSKGGIKVIPANGKIGDNNSVYISSEDLGSAIPSLVPTPSSGTPKTNWRAVIGSKFGVDSEGNLYANEAHISGTFTVKAGSESNIYTKDESDEKVQEEVEKVISVKETSGNIVHIEDASEYPALSLKVHITPKQSGTGTPSPENVRQISGWESVSVFDTGVNVWDEEWEQGGLYNSTGLPNDLATSYFRTKNFIPIKPSTTYYFKTSGDSLWRFYYDANKNFLSYAGGIVNSADNTVANACYMKFVNVSGNSYDSSSKPISINYPSTDHDYHAYTGTTTPVNLGRTVYGGTLDVVSGVLTAYPFYPSYNGETLNGRWICDRAVYAEGTTPPTGSQVALISGTGTTYQLTPTEVNTLLGENNVWADAGQVDLKYASMNSDMNALMNKSNADIEDASKIATNYLKFEPHKGLMIADQTSGIQTIDATTQRNVLIDPDSVDIRDGQNVLAKFGAYTAIENETEINKNGAQIGKQNTSHIDLDYHSLQLIDKEGNSYFHVSDLRDDRGEYTVTFEDYGFDNTGIRVPFLGVSDSDNVLSMSITWDNVGVETTITDDFIDIVSVDEDLNTGETLINITVWDETHTHEIAVADPIKATVSVRITGVYTKAYTAGLSRQGIISSLSFCEGYNNEASGAYSHAEGSNNCAIGPASHAEGMSTRATWRGCHAEGTATIAHGDSSHAEGNDTIAGHYSHAEGYSTKASYCSHAEGWGTTASGEYSHTGGYYTVAGYSAQTVIGKYNDNKSKNLFEIGYGSDSTHRANVLEVDKNGNVVAAGYITSAISACGAAGTADMALPQSEKKITLSTSRGRVGPYLSNSNGGVKCGKSGYVEISGCVYFSSGFTNNDIVHTVVKKNSTQVINAAHRLPASYDYYSVPPLVCEVSEGDILYLYAYNQTGARGYVRAATESWLTVKYL